MERFGLRRRNALVATLFGAAGALSLSGTAAASETWCDVDPPVVIRTPEGNLRVVYVVTSGPPQLLASLLLPAIDCEVRPAQGGEATRVQLSVTVKDTLGLGGLLGLSGRQAVRSEVWSGPARTGELLSSVDGVSGSPMRHSFKLDVA